MHAPSSTTPTALTNPTTRRIPLAALALAGLCALAAPAFAEEAASLEVSVAAAEKDPSLLAKARAAVDAEIAKAPSAKAWTLSARVSLAEAAARQDGSERKAAFERAKGDLAKAEALDARDADVFLVRARLLEASGAPKEEALEGLRQAVVRAPLREDLRDEWLRRARTRAYLRVGDPFPEVVWKDSAGRDVPASSLWKRRPLVVEFYRSAITCSFCQKQLLELHDRIEDFRVEDVELIAVSPDTGDTIGKIEKEGFKGKKPFAVRLLSDPAGAAAIALGVVDPDSLKPGTKPADVGVPQPTTVIVGTDGIVRFLETHEAFRDRVKPDTMLVEVRRLKSSSAVK